MGAPTGDHTDKSRGLSSGSVASVGFLGWEGEVDISKLIQANGSRKNRNCCNLKPQVMLSKNHRVGKSNKL